VSELIDWEAPETALACRILFRERGEDEAPEAFMREYARVSPYGHELARRVLQRLAWHYSTLFPASDPSRITWVWMASAPSRRRERRAWAVWDRKRRARRKR
jgi:hypothetical protein